MKSITELIPQIDGSAAVALEPVVVECETCEDLGVVKWAVPVGHPEFGKFHPCDDCERGRQMLRDRYERRLRSSGLSPKYRSLTFNTFADLPQHIQDGKMLAYMLGFQMAHTPSHTMSLHRAYEMAKRKPSGADVLRNSLVVTGGYGVGKTGLAAAVVNALADNGLAVPLYVRVDDLMDDVRASFDDRNKETSAAASEIIDTVRQAEVLILDEFVITHLTDFVRGVMEKIVRYRHSHSLPTLVTTNDDRRGLEKAWGRRTIDVLLEMSHFVPMGGEKLRDTGAEKREVF